MNVIIQKQQQWAEARPQKRLGKLLKSNGKKYWRARQNLVERQDICLEKTLGEKLEHLAAALEISIHFHWDSTL